MQVGNPAGDPQYPGLTYLEQVAHFQLWCIGTMPLIAGAF